MPTTTINCNKDSRIAHRNSDGWDAGSGTSNYVISGLTQGYKFRSLFGFSYSFTGWTAITAATLKAWTGTQFFLVFGSDPDIYARRLTTSWSEGTANALSGTNAVRWDNQPGYTSTNQVLVDVPTTESTLTTWDITALMQDAFAAGVFHGIQLGAASETDESDAIEWYARELGTTRRARIDITYETNNAPNAPTGLAPTGDTVVHTLLPTFTGTSSDPDSGDSMTGVEVEVVNDAENVTMWASGMLAASGTTFSVNYAGSVLTGNTFYKWRARTKDVAGATGPYSSYQRFKVNSVPSSPSVSLQESPTSDILTLTPTFQLTHNDPDPSDTLAYKYQIILELSSGSAVWDSGEVSLGTPANSVTRLYNGPALNWQTGYRWKARTQDSNSAWSPYSGYPSFTTHTTAVPINLQPTASATASSTTPTLTGSRGDSDDTLTSARVRVYQDDGINLVWDSDVFTSGVSASAFSKVVGVTLTANTFYKWQVQATGSIGGTSAYSALQRFATPATTAPTQTTPLGTGITDTTPDLTFTRATNFNIHTLDLYSEDDGFVTPIWSDAPVAYAATGSKAVTTGVTLAFGKRYRWRVRVSDDGGSNWSAYAGPSEFTMDIAREPVLTAPINNAWQTTLTPTLTGDTQSAETIVTFRIILYASDQQTQIWDSGDLAGSGTSFSKVYNGPALTAGSQYFWKASYIKTSGVPGPYSPLATFHINIAPNEPTNRVPATGFVYADDATPVAPTFSADFSDGDKTTWGDFPTKWEVEVTRNSDGVVMYTLDRTTSLSGGTNTMTDGDVGVTKTLGPGGASLSAEVEYKWRTRYTDSKSAIGAWSAFNIFKPSQIPTVAQIAPIGAGTVNSPSFLIDWTFTSPGSKTQQTYRVRVQRDIDTTIVHDTGVIFGSTTQYTLPAGFLVNNTAYRIFVNTTDTDGLSSAQADNTFSTLWTAPDAPEEFSAVDDPDTSSILMTWTITNLLDVDFSHYQIYRRKPGDANWTAHIRLTNKSTVEARDYLAAHAIIYDYYLTVIKKVPGDVDIESVASPVASSILDLDAWWVVGADRAADHIFELPVIRAPFREPIQQESFEPVGTDRKTIVRGRVLGAEGTMEVQFEATTVPVALLQLDYIKRNAGPHILKSPFGDAWQVEFSGPDKDYQPVGHLKTTLAWTEVA